MSPGVGFTTVALEVSHYHVADYFCRIKETLPAEVAAKMHAPPQDESIPFATPATMTEYDAFVRLTHIYTFDVSTKRRRLYKPPKDTCLPLPSVLPRPY
jgi:hypothetical protein